MKDLLKKYLGDDVKVEEFLNEMKTNKIYTSKEDNIDIRYGKLKENFDALTTKEQEAQALIEELKKSNQGNEDLQGKIKEYETKIQDLEKQNHDMAVENAMKFKLLSSGAKPNDIDYLIFRLKQQKKEFKLDENGEVKGLNEDIEGLKKNCISNFESKANKKVDVLDLPKDPNNEPTITKEQFNKMGYHERNKIFNENKELYDKLVGKGE